MIVSPSSRILDKLEVYAQRPQTQLTVRQLFEFGANSCPEVLLKAAQFLKREFCIRLAHMAKDLENLPLGLSEMSAVKRVQDLYIASFADLYDFPYPETTEDEARFTELIEKIKSRHARVVQMIASGVSDLKSQNPHAVQMGGIKKFLDRFYTARIGIRMLIGQHIALHRPVDGWVGILQEHASPADVARMSVERANEICRRNYGDAPTIDVLGNVDLTFTYIPSHMGYMFFELLKNSLRATMEKHKDAHRAIPNVKVIIAGGEQDVTIKIEDEGGGIRRSDLGRVWTYFYTTAIVPEVNDTYTGDFDPMAGLGYGLPLARLYARYFGGDLSILSMEGYGTDAYLYLNRLGDQQEALP